MMKVTLRVCGRAARSSGEADEYNKLRTFWTCAARSSWPWMWVRKIEEPSWERSASWRRRRGVGNFLWGGLWGRGRGVVVVAVVVVVVVAVVVVVDGGSEVSGGRGLGDDMAGDMVWSCRK